jgi:hypothetical protein
LPSAVNQKIWQYCAPKIGAEQSVTCGGSVGNGLWSIAQNSGRNRDFFNNIRDLRRPVIPNRSSPLSIFSRSALD